MAQCKHGVSALPTVSQATKHRLEAICDKAASGDAATARAAAREGCEEIVKAAPLPEGTAKQRALSACKSAETPDRRSAPSLRPSSFYLADNRA